MAKVNLFKISLDRIGRTVYQYDGEFPHLPPSLLGSHDCSVGQCTPYMLPTPHRFHFLTSSVWVLRYYPGDHGKAPHL